MASNNDDFVVKIKVDPKALQAGLRQAAKEAELAGKAIERNLGGSVGKMEKALSAASGIAKTAFVAIGAGAVAAGGAFLLAEKRALDFADGLVKASDITGVSIEKLQELRFVAGQTGVSLEELDGGLEKYTRLLGQAQAGNKAAGESFQALGVSVTDASGAPRQTELVLMDVLRVLERIPDANARAAAAQEVFGRSSTRMSVLAAGGAGSIDQMVESARQAGLIINGDLVRAGDAAGDSIDKLQSIIRAGLTKALLQAAPEIERFINELTADPQKIQEVAAAIVDTSKAVVEIGVKAAQWIGSIRDFFEAMDARKVVSEFNLASKSVEYYKDRLAVAERFGLDTQVEIMTEGLRRAETQFANADRAREKFVAGVVGSALGANLQKALGGINGPAVDIPLNLAPAPKAIDTGTFDYKDRSGEAKEKSRQAELDAVRRHNKQLIDDARSAVATEIELENMKHRTQLAGLQALNEAEFGGVADKHQLLEQLEARHQEKLVAIQTQASEASNERFAAEREAFAEREAMLDAFDIRLQDAAAQEIFQEEQRYLAKRAMFETFSAEELELIGGYNAVKEAMELEHWAKLGQIQADSLNSQFDFMQFAKTREQAFTAGLANKALQMFSGQSKKMFELNKALSLAQTAVALPAAIMESYKNAGGYPWGIAAAASMAAIGAAQIRAIASAKFGGGSSPPVTGAAAAGGGVVGDTNAPGAAPRQVSITLVGNGLVGMDQIRGLIEQINEALGDGAKLNVA